MEEIEYLTQKQVATYLKISIPTLYARVKDGVFHPIKFGRSVRFEKNQFLSDLALLQKFEYAPRVREKFPPR